MLLLIAAGAYVAFAALRSVPELSAAVAPGRSVFRGRLPGLGWPAQGEAAVALDGVGVIGSHGPPRPTPIASLAKVMTAYVVLRDHPLGATGGGPQIHVTPGDVAIYRADRAAGQSVVDVQAGETLDERQALEGLLLPSGNNIASLLATWDAHSQRAFVTRMNATARGLGLAHTRYTDASGVQPGTVSTASDQVRLALRAMALPAFRQTVALTQVNLPVAGRQYNLDGLLGKDGIVGIKTGTTSQAGGCFVFAATARVAGRPATITGAVLHQMATRSQPSILAAAFQAATSVLDATRPVLRRRRVLSRGTPLAMVSAPWGGNVALEAARSVAFAGWPGLSVRTVVTVRPHVRAPVTAGQRLGTAVLTAGAQRATVPLVAAGSLGGPSLGWRLAHP